MNGPYRARNANPRNPSRYANRKSQEAAQRGMDYPSTSSRKAKRRRNWRDEITPHVVRDALERLLPNERLPESGWAAIRCPHPQHNDKAPSAGVSVTTGGWRCHACGQGGSLVDLVMITMRIDFKAALEWLGVGR